MRRWLSAMKQLCVLKMFKDIYKIRENLCKELIELYDKSARQLYNLALAWDSFRSKRRTTKLNDNTGSDTVKHPTLNHLGIAVKDINASLKIWQEFLRLRLLTIEEVLEQRVKVAILDAGNTHIELLEPSGPDSTVARFIEKKGEGLHHIAFEVDNIEETLDNLKKSGVKLINENPRRGAQGSKIAFIHPQSTNGVLVELCQH